MSILYCVNEYFLLPGIAKTVGPRDFSSDDSLLFVEIYGKYRFRKWAVFEVSGRLGRFLDWFRWSVLSIIFDHILTISSVISGTSGWGSPMRTRVPAIRSASTECRGFRCLVKVSEVVIWIGSGPDREGNLPSYCGLKKCNFWCKICMSASPSSSLSYVAWSQSILFCLVGRFLSGNTSNT